MSFFDHWLEGNSDEDVGPFSHWNEDNEGIYDLFYPCETCVHNGKCNRQKFISSGDDCDNWVENK